MKNDIKVSVIVPIYNVEQYLKKCIYSILNQLEKNIEIILIDDGSKDNSSKIINYFAKLDDRIKVILKENSGVADTRNIGIQESTGEYIIFIDSDDWIDNNMIYEMYNIAQKYKSDYIRCAHVKEMKNRKIYFRSLFEHEICIEKKEFTAKIYPYFINSYMLNSSCAALIKRDTLVKNNIKFKSKCIYGEDLLFNLELFSYLNKATFIPNYFYHYNYNDNSITTTANSNVIKEKIISAYNVYSSLYKYIDKWKIYDEYKDKVDKRLIKELIVSLNILFYFNKGLTFDKKILILNECYDVIFNDNVNYNNIFLKLYKLKKYKTFILLGQVKYGFIKLFKDFIKKFIY